MNKLPIPLVSTCFATIAMVAWFGCGDPHVAGSTGVGNPPQSAVAFTMVADQGVSALAKRSIPFQSVASSAFTITDKGGSRFILESALINVGHVKFKLPDGIDCSADLEEECEVDQLKIQGPFLADLMTGSFTPAFPTFQAPHGAYRRIALRLETLEKDAAVPDTALRGHTLLLSGTFSYGDRTDRKFTILFDFNEEAQFDSGSMEVREQALNRVLLKLNVNSWMPQADITGCLDNEDLALDEAGNLRIDKDNSCEGLEENIKEGIKASGNLEEDSEEKPDESP